MGYPNTCPDCNGHFDPGHTCPPIIPTREYLESEIAKLRKKNTEAYTLRANDILALQREREEKIKLGVQIWEGAMQELGMWKLMYTLRDAEHAQDHEDLDKTAEQLHALHNEFRVAAARLKFVANWLENIDNKDGDNSIARSYANAAKEVLDKGLIWLVEQKRY